MFTIPWIPHGVQHRSRHISEAPEHLLINWKNIRPLTQPDCPATVKYQLPGAPIDNRNFFLPLEAGSLRSGRWQDWVRPFWVADFLPCPHMGGGVRGFPGGSHEGTSPTHGLALMT